jgi:hypothetical protein
MIGASTCGWIKGRHRWPEALVVAERNGQRERKASDICSRRCEPGR